MERDMNAMSQFGRCFPKAEEVKTGLLVTVTFYTDQECTELFKPEENQNRAPNNECFNLEKEECAKKEGCEFETEGRGRLSTPHCKPEGDRFQGGRDREEGERPCQEDCGEIAQKCREDMGNMRDRRAAMMALRRCMMGFGDDDCAKCLEENKPEGRDGDSNEESRDGGRGGRGGRRLLADQERGGRPQGGNQQGGRPQGGNQQGGRPGGDGDRQGFRPNRFAGNRARGQDARDRGRGGNPNQNKRIQENPVMRVIPVIDDEGEEKCSFDARGDQRSGVFRKTMCVEPNTIQDVLYTDMLCEEEADRETVPLVRGECMPLPMQGQAMERRPGNGQGGRGQGGRGGQGGPKGRRLMDKELGEDGAPMAPKCDGQFNQGWSWETLKDLWDELTCDTDEAEEGDDVDKDDEDRMKNPCRFLSKNECMTNDACDV